MKKTIVCGHIAAVLDILGVFVWVFILFLGFIGTINNFTHYDGGELAGNSIALVILFIIITFKFTLAIFREIVIAKLQQGRRWSWIASIVLNILMLFGWRIILGVVALVGLFDQTTMTYFKKPTSTSTSPNTL